MLSLFNVAEGYPYGFSGVKKKLFLRLSLLPLECRHPFTVFSEEW
jgi:hypothetical protein